MQPFMFVMKLRCAVVASVIVVGALSLMASSAAAVGSSAPTGLHLGEVFHDPAGDSAILIGMPGATNSSQAANASPESQPASCSSGYACAYESTGYSTSNYSYAFPERYTPYQDLSGGCYSLDYGSTFNDCTSSVYNNYGSCSYVQWWWNAGYGGNSFDNNDFSGDTNLGNINQANEFSSQINCN